MLRLEPNIIVKGSGTNAKINVWRYDECSPVIIEVNQRYLCVLGDHSLRLTLGECREFNHQDPSKNAYVIGGNLKVSADELPKLSMKDPEYIKMCQPTFHGHFIDLVEKGWMKEDQTEPITLSVDSHLNSSFKFPFKNTCDVVQTFEHEKFVDSSKDFDQINMKTMYQFCSGYFTCESPPTDEEFQFLMEDPRRIVYAFTGTGPTNTSIFNIHYSKFWVDKKKALEAKVDTEAKAE